MLVVGSSAVNLGRKPKDRDLICTWKEFEESYKGLPKWPINEGKTWIVESDGMKWEHEIAWPGSTGEELLEILNVKEGDTTLADLDVVYTMKMSHRFLKNSPHFHKTMRDIHFLRKQGAEIFDQTWYSARVAETYSYEHPNLDRTKEEFFVDEYKFDHDLVHEAVAIGSKPAYEWYKIPGEEVKCSKTLFESQTEWVRLNGVYEEAAVLSIERSLVPFQDQAPDPDLVFAYALMKVCSSITSGWFREYAWENYDRVLELFEEIGGGERLLRCIRDLEREEF